VLQGWRGYWHKVRRAAALLRNRELNPTLGVHCLGGGEIKVGDEYLFGLALVEHPESLAGDGVVLYLAALSIAKYQNGRRFLERCGGFCRARGRLLPRALLFSHLLHFLPQSLNFLDQLLILAIRRRCALHYHRGTGSVRGLIVDRRIICGIYIRIEEGTPGKVSATTETLTAEEDAEVRIMPESGTCKDKSSAVKTPSSEALEAGSGRHRTESWPEAWLRHNPGTGRKHCAPGDGATEAHASTELRCQLRGENRSRR
jgi:hypothetical protein